MLIFATHIRYTVRSCEIYRDPYEDEQRRCFPDCYSFLILFVEGVRRRAEIPPAAAKQEERAPLEVADGEN